MSGEFSLGDGQTSSGYTPKQAPDAIGAVIGGRYEVVRMLGQGGMGSVYECHDRRLSRFLAVKRMVVTGAAAQARFEREARAIASLSHPNIVTLFDYDTDERGAFIVMELLAGTDLGDHIKKHGVMPLDDVRAVAIQISKALIYAHSKGIVHRDIKPSNILILNDGTIKVIDFGLVTAAGNSQLSMVGVGLGTAEYVAPEQQLDGSRADARSDQFSLGLTLCFLLLGYRPKVLREQEIPIDLRGMILRMLEEDPADRYPSLDSVLTLLESHQRPMSSSSPASVDNTAERPWERPVVSDEPRNHRQPSLDSRNIESHQSKQSEGQEADIPASPPPLIPPAINPGSKGPDAGLQTVFNKACERSTYRVLGFLAPIGLHNLYAKYYRRGFWQFGLICVAFMWPSCLIAFSVVLWSWYDAAFTTHDATGKKMK